MDRYTQTFIRAVKTQDSNTLRSCLCINPIGNDGPNRLRFSPSDFDLYQVPEKFQPVVKSHISLMKAIYVEKLLALAFTELNDMVNHLIRASESQTNWINPVLINSINELIAIYKTKESRNPETIEEDEEEYTTKKKSALEELANTINKAFKLSLNDKNLDLQQSKRIDIYYFLSNLIKVYFKMNKLELAKLIEKAIKGTKFQLPEMISGLANNKKCAIVYLYYTALLSLDDGEFVETESKLTRALEILTCYNSKSNKQTRQVLFLLLPVKLLNHGVAPSSLHKIWLLYPELRIIYKDNLFRCISQGNISGFNRVLSKYTVIFLQSHLFLTVELLKQQVYMSLIKKVTHEVVQHGANHIIPLSAYQLGFELSSYGWKVDNFKTSLDEVECVMANLIGDGKIKGYLSHSNRCIVLSKGVAFPRALK